MAIDLHVRPLRVSLGALDVDVRRVFDGAHIDGGALVFPAKFYVLPDFRLASEDALRDACEGIAPSSEKLGRFDPSLGPFTAKGVELSPWAQSLDFLRDIKNSQLGSSRLSHLWVKGWLAATAHHLEKHALLPLPKSMPGSKTDRLVWRARRVLNCLSHILPLLHELEDEVHVLFWRVLASDIAKLGAPTDTLWASLTEGFHPVSQRAIWLRAVALLGVEAAFPGLLRRDLVARALDTVEASIQSDGMFIGGSVIGTLSAAADLCMLGRIARVDPILQTIRVALATLRRTDGHLVTFGLGSGGYKKLMSSIMGPGQWKRAPLLSGSGIVYAQANGLNIWLRTPQNGTAWGAVCDIEALGVPLLSNYGDSNSGLELAASARVSQPKCKRRDDETGLTLEASAILELDGKTFRSLRQIRISQNGAKIDGEDFVTSESPHEEHYPYKLCFAVSRNASCALSGDKKSVLIVTSQQQAWRFRIQSMDISLEKRPQKRKSAPDNHQIDTIICVSTFNERNRNFRAIWQLCHEDVL
jgi:hypothetical protein